MKLKLIHYLLALSGVAALAHPLHAATGLQVTYNDNGLAQLSYNGSVLADTVRHPSDAFHIWHMKATDLQGNDLKGGQFDWGEVNQGRQWDVATRTWTYRFVWGSIKVQFQQVGDTLNMNVVQTNSANSGIVFNGATIYPFVLRFPRLPKGFTDPSWEQLAFNTTGPSVTIADFGSGLLAAVATDPAKPLYSGFEPAGGGNNYFPIISSTAIDGMASFFPRNDRPIAPGETDSFTVSLRFAPSGTPPGTIASDAFQNWSKAFPSTLQWNDRRIIGTVYLASSAEGTPTQPIGYPNNPRRYFNSNSPSDFDVRSADGLQRFQNRILQQASNNVTNLRQLNAQGVITWDIEGQQYPHDTSYVCSPDLIGQVAPEMESIITDPSSAYKGMKLADAYFKTMRDAGFRVGVCVRPQHFTLYGNGSAKQVFLDDSQVKDELLRKIRYAHDRWGATLFYIDSVVQSNGGTLDAGILEQVTAAMPDSLIMPEQTTAKYYRFSAPFKSFIFHRDFGTPDDIYNFYPKAFSVNLVNDVSAATLAQYRQQLTASVRRGDILMVHAGYWQDNNSTVVQMYKDAGFAQPSNPEPQPVPSPQPPATPEPAPVPVPEPTPVPAPAPSTAGVAITNIAAGQILSGSIFVDARITISLDAAGSYLMVDGNQVGTRRISEGPYRYALDTTKLPNGQHRLQIWAHNTANQTVLSESITVTVNNTGLPESPAPADQPATPAPIPTPPQQTARGVVLSSPVSGQSVSGVIDVQANIANTLSAAGSYLMVDGKPVGLQRITNPPYSYTFDTNSLSPGQHTLQVWALDTNNENLMSAIVPINVTH